MQTDERAIELIKGLCNSESIDLDTKLQDDLALDSLMMVSLLIEIEDTFGIRLDESDMNPFDLITVADVIRLIQKYRGKNDETS